MFFLVFFCSKYATLIFIYFCYGVAFACLHKRYKYTDGIFIVVFRVEHISGFSVGDRSIHMTPV